MSIKQNGGVFGRNPTFNDVTIEGQLTFEGNIDIDSDITWEDDKKALFGNNGELAIYHHNNGTSYIQETGSGDLSILGTNFRVMNAAGTQNKIVATTGGAVTLYENNNPKLTTTSAGCDITGTATMDGLTVDGNNDIQINRGGTSAVKLFFDRSGTVDGSLELGADENLTLSVADDGRAGQYIYFNNNTKRVMALADGGDISFYEDTGTTPKLFWDASAESLGIGTSSPTGSLTLANSTNDSNGIKMQATGWPYYARSGINGTTGAQFIRSTNWNANSNAVDSSGHATTAIIQDTSSGNIKFSTGTTNTVPVEALSINASQDVAIPNGTLTVSSTNPTITIEDSDATSTYNKTEFQNANGGLNLNTRQSNGTFVSTDYQMGKNASGAIEHKWNTNGQLALKVDSSQDVAIPNGDLTVGSFAKLAGTSELFLDSGASGTNKSGLRFETNGLLPRKNFAMDTGGNVSLGNATYKFSEVFAVNGTINTSDRNEKQDIEFLTEAEERVAVAAKSLLKKFRWKDAVEAKGDDARIHFGIIAQDLQAAFEAEGLDAGRYGMFTSNTWWEHDVEVPAVEAVEGVEGVATVEAQEAVMGERQKMETVETGTYVNLAGETITETQEVGVTEDVVQTVVERQDIDGVMTEVEVEKTVSVPVMESYEVSPAVEAVAGVEYVEAVESADAYTRTDTYDTAEEAPEGSVEKTRMGVRYSELLAFIISAI